MSNYVMPIMTYARVNCRAHSGSVRKIAGLMHVEDIL